LLQRARNAKQRVIAKMDAIRQSFSVKPGTYYLLRKAIPEFVNMDASVQKVLIIPA
jgi:hypothetical protein